LALVRARARRFALLAEIVDIGAGNGGFSAREGQYRKKSDRSEQCDANQSSPTGRRRMWRTGQLHWIGHDCPLNWYFPTI
jgi:hypothetical protein